MSDLSVWCPVFPLPSATFVLFPELDVWAGIEHPPFSLLSIKLESIQFLPGLLPYPRSTQKPRFLMNSWFLLSNFFSYKYNLQRAQITIPVPSFASFPFFLSPLSLPFPAWNTVLHNLFLILALSMLSFPALSMGPSTSTLSTKPNSY